jgi:exodeoxyribonuclease V alpha subunit
MYDKEIIKNGIDNVQVIMPYKKGDLGVNKINNYIRDNYNENKLDDRYGYKINDKICHIKNNYGKGVFNGEVGKVTMIDNEEDFLEVTYDTGKIIYEIDDIDETILAYSLTCHKVQGSEYPVVFVLIDDENPLLLYRRLLYTACSRPKQKLILLSMNNSVEKAILNGYYRPRVTMLSKFLLT